MVQKTKKELGAKIKKRTYKKFGNGLRDDVAKELIHLKRKSSESEKNAVETLQKYKKMRKPTEKNLKLALAEIKRSDTKQKNEIFNAQRERELKKFGTPKWKVGDVTGFTRLPDRERTGTIIKKQKRGDSTIFTVDIKNVGVFDFDSQLLRPITYPINEKL
tara:strand:+ start:180 stop:662 length:483 start_codon:yes stop_codon:yes gene_type:complete